ncbi:hypothetical protein B5M42_014710 [Paenibacillus athensensis]|uniref:hypothetical protein n=1 Tax=Paenibacillus athensensis TaxID=1967502 RepID=UPI001431B61E|nr:hypothetical protein [Paenibacillus athensensis]MCD1260063.1 hypothetical protein [Paenibacillus athensensis]
MPAWLELTGWIAVFAVLTGTVITLIARGISRDSTAYDLIFVWDGNYTAEELGLAEKP